MEQFSWNNCGIERRPLDSSSGADTGFKWGGESFFRKKIHNYRNKNCAAGENFFDLKDSKRVKIND